VDVVVRDHKGKPVTDLTAADFEVFEDRVAQKIDTFTRVTRGGGIGVDVKWKHPGATVAIFPAGSVPPPSQARDAADQATTALVFDHLGDESLGLAQKATLEYVPMSGDSDVRVGVFATEPSVRVVQSYTTDRSAVRRAVSQIMPAGTSAAQQKAERRDEVMDSPSRSSRWSSCRSPRRQPPHHGGKRTVRCGLTEAELRMLEMERTQIDGFDQLDREHKGYDTTLALYGRHSIARRNARPQVDRVLLEGLPVSPVLSARFDDLIDAANRSNVTCMPWTPTVCAREQL
jgi:VWFA-related protein